MRISDWSSDVCSSDLDAVFGQRQFAALSRLADQDDDALPHLRGYEARQDQEDDARHLFRAGRRPAADKTRREGGQVGYGRDRDLFAGKDRKGVVMGKSLSAQ